MPDVYSNLLNQFPNLGSLTTNPDISSNPTLQSIQTKTSDLQTYLNNVQAQSNVELTHQAAMNNIVTSEHARLIQKKQSVDNAYSSQQRAIHMNDNLQKLYNAYSKILIAVVIGATCLFALVFLQPYLPFVPSTVFIITYIIIISTVLIYSYIVYTNIQKHERIDYDRLYMKPMTANSSDFSGDDFSFNFNALYCQNEQCCVSGSTIYDTSLGRCVSITKPVEHMQNMLPNYLYEFSTYSKYN
jgi:hypothetical protein